MGVEVGIIWTEGECPGTRDRATSAFSRGFWKIKNWSTCPAVFSMFRLIEKDFVSGSRFRGESASL